MTIPEQPSDSWDYVRTESDDEDPLAHPDPELTALHFTDGDDHQAQDPANRDDGVEVDDGDDGPRASHFPDEEPERAGWSQPDEHEPDLEEILEAQHYAFPDERPEDDEARA